MTFKFPYPKKVDKKFFKSDQVGPPLYGLPIEVKFCNNCVISNQRPSSAVEFKNDGVSNKEVINFDSNNLCDACKVKDIKQSINWEERERELRDLCDKYRKNDGNYDCLIPGSGGKDSFMQAHILKYKYGMNPLTCTWAPHIYTGWGWKNHQAWIHAGFDNILFTPNGIVHRLLTRIAIEKLFHPFQPFMIGQKNFPPKIAYLYDISLIFYGENEAEYGNKKQAINNSSRSKEFFAEENIDNIYLGGASLSELEELSLRKVDFEPYMPINPEKLIEKDIEVHYLGYFEKWHPQSAYYYAVENGDFICSPERTIGTYQTYTSIDDKIDDFHYHTTYIKFGIGRATYDASQEIRSGDITREEGVSLVNKYDGEFPDRWSTQIYDYLSLDKNKFPQASLFFEEPIFTNQYYMDLADTFRSPHIWKWTDENNWELRNKVINLQNIKSTIKDWKGNR